jgi:hypothetical protein
MAIIIPIQNKSTQQEQPQTSNQLITLTEKQVRAYPAFANATDEEVLHIIDTLHQLALITYNVITSEMQQEQIHYKKAA